MRYTVPTRCGGGSVEAEEERTERGRGDPQGLRLALVRVLTSVRLAKVWRKSFVRLGCVRDVSRGEAGGDASGLQSTTLGVSLWN